MIVPTNQIKNMCRSDSLFLSAYNWSNKNSFCHFAWGSGAHHWLGCPESTGRWFVPIAVLMCRRPIPDKHHDQTNAEKWSRHPYRHTLLSTAFSVFADSPPSLKKTNFVARRAKKLCFTAKCNEVMVEKCNILKQWGAHLSSGMGKL